MSADFESAIAEGATLVRIGTALFGSRWRNNDHRKGKRMNNIRRLAFIAAATWPRADQRPDQAGFAC